MATQSGPQQNLPGPARPGAEFDENAYLAAFPDISAAVASGYCSSALSHFIEHGSDEGRLGAPAYQAAVARSETQFFPVHNVDQVLVTDGGFILVEGWIDDEVAPLGTIRLLDGDRFVAAAAKASRHRRHDVEACEAIEPGQRVGFWALVRDQAPRMPDQFLISLSAATFRRVDAVATTIVSLEAMRRRVLSLVGATRRAGMSIPELALQLEGSPSAMVARLDAELFARHVAGVHGSRFGEASRPVDISVIVRLHSNPDPVFLHSALSDTSPAAPCHELIYILDDPALGEQVLREASASARTYGLLIKVVFLPGRVGYGAAINAAARFAEGSRLLLVDPQVFPSRPGWLRSHAEILSSRPADDTAIFGASLSAAGEASHGTVEIVVEDGVASIAARTQSVSLLALAQRQRWHPRPPGGPDPGSCLSLPRHVVSLDRALFERLEGLAQDLWSADVALADFSLRCRSVGIWPREHLLPFVHLPISDRPATTEDEAADILDRCRLTATWLDTLKQQGVTPRGSSPAPRFPMPVPRGGDGSVAGFKPFVVGRESGSRNERRFYTVKA